jgi:glutamine synthetase
MKISAEYIWIDGSNADKPTKTLRSKNQILQLGQSKNTPKEKTFGQLSTSVDQYEMANLLRHQNWWGDGPEMPLQFRMEDLLDLQIPDWGFDGSSTLQADAKPSDRPLIPVCALINPLRKRSILILCEVFGKDGKHPHATNTRRAMVETYARFTAEEPWFGIEQEYTLYHGGLMARVPYGWPEKGPATEQGKYYCGVGLDEAPGRQIAMEHEDACRDAGLLIRGTNAEVMPGQWEFQTDTGNPVTVSDHLWLMRYLLYRIAAKHNASVKLDPKPVSGDWNGAGAHTNFSTLGMRKEYSACEEACKKLETNFKKNGFPSMYGAGYEKRLTGAHETCSHKEFRYGVADRAASIRIPLHVKVRGAGYIEDRRPCANIDPYEVTTFLMKTICKV